MEEKNKGVDLSLLLAKFVGALKRVWILLLILPILFGFFSYSRAKKSFVPMYEAKAYFTVESGYQAEDIIGAKPYFDQYAAEQLAGVFPRLLNTGVMRNYVLQEMESGYINGTAVAETVVDTHLLLLTVQSTDREDAFEYLQAIIASYPKVAIYMVDYPQITIMGNPEVPTEPFNSFNPISAIAMGALVGVAIPLVLALLLALFATTFQSVDELKAVVNMPVLISLPRVARKARRSKERTDETLLKDPNMKESLRGLRMKLKKLLEGGKKIVVITSTISGEGKTTVAMNIAMSLVRDGKKVLLVDGDFRKQSIGAVLGQEETPGGLIDHLANPDIDPKSLIRQHEKLDFISGKSTSNRHYSLTTGSVRRVLDTLAVDYDYVIVDAPPCEAVSDAAALARCADCVLYVVKQNYVRRDQLINAVTALYGKDVKISGCVFNGVASSGRRYGYGYGYGYGYNYGYNYGYGYGYKKYGYGKYGKYGYSKYAKEEAESEE